MKLPEATRNTLKSAETPLERLEHPKNYPRNAHEIHVTLLKPPGALLKLPETPRTALELP